MELLDRSTWVGVNEFIDIVDEYPGEYKYRLVSGTY